MGCFDTLVPKKQDWKCWKCGRLLDKDYDTKKQSLQTKELGEHLRIFHEGKEILLQSSEIECTLGDGTLIVYDYCAKSPFPEHLKKGDDGCNHMNYFKAIIKNGKWIATRQMPVPFQKRWNKR